MSSLFHHLLLLGVLYSTSAAVSSPVPRYIGFCGQTKGPDPVEDRDLSQARGELPVSLPLMAGTSHPLRVVLSGLNVEGCHRRDDGDFRAPQGDL